MADASSASQKNLVVLGGSYGGVSVAHNLLKHTLPKLPDPSAYKVVIISTSSQVICRPGCPRALISDSLLPQDKFFVNTAKQFEQYPKDNFRFVQGTATELDHAARRVSINLVIGGSENLSFHALVIATGGSTPSPLFSLNGTSDDLRASWTKFREALPNAKTIVVAGGGPTGFETAGELGEYLNGRPGWFSSSLPNPKVNVTLITSAKQLLPILRPSIAEKAEGELAKVGVTVIKNQRVTSVSPEGAGTARALTSKATLILEDGKTVEADLYIPATGSKANTSFVSKELLTSDGRVNTDPHTLRVLNAGERIYAIGDVASYSRPAIHLMMEAIPVLSSNIKRDLLLDAGKTDAEVPKERNYKEDTRETHLVPIGRNRGVGAAMGWSLPSFMVWAIKGRDYWLWTTAGLWSGKQWAKEQ